MQAKAKITGVANTRIRLKNISEKVAENARKVMNRGSDAIIRDAQINCPVDEDSLASTIRAEKGKEARDSGGHGGRLTIVLTFGGVSPVTGRDTDSYAMIVHENYEGMLRYGPGPNTLAKMQAYPDHTIGSHFLTRAADDQRPKLEANMIKAVELGVNGMADIYFGEDIQPAVDANYGNTFGKARVSTNAYADYIRGFKGANK